MSKKWIWMISLSAIVILGIAYWYYFSSPSALPDDVKLAEQINEVFPEADAETIQATIKLDEKHVYVPFISSNEGYGASFWEWGGRKWKPSYIDTSGEPLLWKVDENDPLSYHIVWNLNPENKIGYAKFYFMRDRNFRVSNNKHRYIPKLQMSFQEEFDDDSYGVFKLPEAWSDTMSQLSGVDSTLDSSMFMTNMRLHFGWTPYDQTGEEIFPKSKGNSGFSNGGIDFDFVPLIDEKELD